jgi:hypothetical protein
MAKKQNNYISAELDFAEEQLASWKEYVLSNPFPSLKDRVEMKQTKTGGIMPMVISTIEQQGKFLQDTMKNYLALLEIVNNLREKEEAKKEARGSATVPHRMQ